jgi:predicted esterase
MGECGTDGWKQTEVGLGAAIRADEARWPFVVVFPQKPDQPSQWIEHGAMVMAMLAETETTCAIDPHRRFLTGISQGGAGTWALGAKHADVFAAIAPVCGYGKPAEVGANLKGTPIWAFHGTDDTVVPPRQSKALCAAVEAVGGAPMLTLYQRTAHNSWDQAYRESNLAEWLRALPQYPSFAQALADPERSKGFRLEVELGAAAAASREQSHERVSLSSYQAPDWRLFLERGGKAVGEPFGKKVSAPEAARCLAACVRLLVQVGVLEREESHPPPEGDYVEVDYSQGIGGRSVSSWPKRWSVNEDSKDLVGAIRRAADLMKQLH